MLSECNDGMAKPSANAEVARIHVQHAAEWQSAPLTSVLPQLRHTRIFMSNHRMLNKADEIILGMIGMRLSRYCLTQGVMPQGNPQID